MSSYPETLLPPVSVAAQKARLEDVLKTAKQAIGGSQIQALTIASGVVTPAAGAAALLRIDTQGAASTDDLDRIAVDHLPDGAVAIIQAANDGRTVVVQHAAGGPGQLLLADAQDFSLDDNKKILWLARVGTSWEEIHRSYGADATAIRAFLSLGTAALANAGTGASEVPTNAQIFDTARDYTRQQRFVPAVLTDASTIAWNLETQQVARVSLGADRSLGNFSNAKSGAGYRLLVVTNGFSITSYGSKYRWPNEEIPDLSAGDWWILCGDYDETLDLMGLSAQGPYSL